jgi:hypothetical protein
MVAIKNLAKILLQCQRNTAVNTRIRKIHDKTPLSHASLNVPVYVKIAVPPKLKLQRTHKDNKMEKQEPRMEGPFTLTHRMMWKAFLTAISNTIDEDLENLLIEDMKWGLQKKAWYPLANNAGYMAVMRVIFINSILYSFHHLILVWSY